MGTHYEFQGWLGHTPKAADGQMEWGIFQPKRWTENDVDIRITHCGVCGSDLHTLRSGWGETPYPCCVGHEIIGTAVRVGSNVTNIKVGDRVGVGAQARSCMQDDCLECSSGKQSYCLRMTGTYGAVYPDDEGKSYGGYADYNRTDGRFVVKIPEGLPSESAAPMLCAGVTMYSPLRHNGCGPGKTVGIIGLGGLGHFGVLFAKALGASKVVAISRRSSKRDEAIAMGADRYVATAGEKDWASENKRSFDMILCTVSSSDMPLSDYLGLLKVDGTYVQIGLPDGGLLPPVKAFDLTSKRIKITGSLVGSPAEIREMLQLAAEKNIKPWVETRPLESANQVIVDMGAGKARYRYVLVNEKHAGKQ